MTHLPARTLLQTLTHTAEGVVLLAEGRVVFWNRSARRLLGCRGIRPPVELDALDPGARTALEERDLSLLMENAPPIRVEDVGCGVTAVYLPPDPPARPHLQRLLEGEQRAVVGQVSGAVAKEIGAPLLAIQATADRLRTVIPETHEAAREGLALILDQTHRITQLSRRLIDLAEPGRPRLTRLEPAAVVRESLDLLSGPIQKAQVKTSFVEPEIPLYAEGDPGHLRQVFLHLVLNACKVLEGYPQRRCLRARIQPSNGDVEIWVEDSGPGVPREESQRIFLPFTSGYGGTGLGLPIARQMLTDMGGSLRLTESSLGGAAFVVSLRKAGDD